MESPELKKAAEEKETKKKIKKIDYIESTGRRKTSIARIRLTKGEGNLVVNEVSAWDYFKDQITARQILGKPFLVVDQKDKFNALIRVHGGGKSSQMGAIVHGLARALDKFNPEFRPSLKKAGLLTRDSRVKERRKYGLAGSARARKPSPKR